MSYQRSMKPSEPEERPLNSFECIAHGCPLPGVFRLKMTGPSPSICRAHDSTPPQEWPAITQRVKQIERALFVAIDLTNSTAGDTPDPHIVSKFVALSADLAPSGKPTARTYGAFVLGRLIERVRPKSDHARALPVPTGLMHVDISL